MLIAYCILQIGPSPRSPTKGESFVFNTWGTNS